MPNITDWLMVGITAVYVVATILICYFNYSSAKATREQTAEARRQYDENNRAFVTVTFEVIRNGSAVLHIHNQGKQIANNVKVKVHKSFIDNVTVEFDKITLERLYESTFTLGIGQSLYASVGSSSQLEKLGKEALLVDISYQDCFSSYSESVAIDITQYFWALMYESSMEDTRQEMKSISKSLKSIDRTLKTARKESSTNGNQDIFASS